MEGEKAIEATIVVTGAPGESTGRSLCSVAPEQEIKRARLLPCFIVAGVILVLAFIANGITVVALGMTDERVVGAPGNVSVYFGVSILAGVTAGLHLIRTGKQKLGGLLLAFGIIVAAGPSVLFLYAKQWAKPSAEDWQPLTVSVEAGQRVAANPHLRFSFPLVADLRENSDLARHIAKTNSQIPRVYAFTRGDVGGVRTEDDGTRAVVLCMVTSSIPRHAYLVDEHVRSFLDSTNKAAPIEGIQQRGAGLDSDVIVVQKTGGIYCYTRLRATVAEDERVHLIFLSCAGLSEDETQRTLEGLVVSRCKQGDGRSVSGAPSPRQ